MSEPVDPVLLARGDSETATDWARHGLAPAYVAGMPRGWVAIAPSGTDAQSAPPYDDAVDVLFGRSLPRTLRPALGLRVVGARLVVSVDLGGRWSRRGWLAWEPGAGLVRPGGLPVAAIDDLAEVAGVRERHTVDALVDVLHDGAGDAVSTGRRLLAVLDLPAAADFGGSGWVADQPGAQLAQPQEQDVARFDRSVRSLHEEDEQSR